MNNYCSQKFWWLTVDLEKQTTASCCTATEEQIDKNWIKDNPGKLFNTPSLIRDRELFLEDKRVPNCDVCWKAEDAGITSRRLSLESNLKTHTDLYSTPSVLHFIVSSDCNLTCSYCSKQFSSSWAQDIVKNGSYNVSSDVNRYQMTTRDRVIFKMSQKELENAPTRSLLLNEVTLLNYDKIIITGGEPFLYLNLFNLIKNLNATTTIEIWTGLGVNSKRLSSEIEKIKSIPNVCIVISAENINELYEFNRFGHTYHQFCKNLEILKESSIPLKFNATMSNTTIFGLADFIENYQDYDISFQLCLHPTFLSPNVLDSESKHRVLESLSIYKERLKSLFETVPQDYTIDQKIELTNFIKEFAKRRNLSLDIFPKSFIKWINE
jgi:organic radical activating enzyme